MNHVNLDSQAVAVQEFVMSLTLDPAGTVLEKNGKPIACLVPAPKAAGTNGTWSNEKNERRCDLIDREIAGTLTPAEVVELHELQQEMLEFRRRVAPLPLDHARALHKQLLAQATTSGA